MSTDSQATPIYGYIVRSGWPRDIPMYERTIYLDGDPNIGFRLWGKVVDENNTNDLSEILLEDALSSELPGDGSASEQVVDGFGDAFGNSLARHIVEQTPTLSAEQRASLALKSILSSLNAPYTVETVAGNLQYRFAHCPLCDAAKRTGIQEVKLAHHGLNAFLQDTIHAIAPNMHVRMPIDRNDEHVFGLVCSS